MDLELDRLRKTAFGIVGAQTSPCPPSKVLREYYDSFGADFPYVKHGYSSMEGFLRDISDIDAVKVDGRTCFISRTTESSADIQAQVRKQKKKKRKGLCRRTPFRTSFTSFPHHNQSFVRSATTRISLRGPNVDFCRSRQYFQCQSTSKPNSVQQQVYRVPAVVDLPFDSGFDQPKHTSSKQSYTDADHSMGDNNSSSISLSSSDRQGFRNSSSSLLPHNTFGSDSLKSSKVLTSKIKSRPTLAPSAIKMINNCFAGISSKGRKTVKKEPEGKSEGESVISFNNAPSDWAMSARSFILKTSQRDVSSDPENQPALRPIKIDRSDSIDLKTRIMSVLDMCNGRSTFSKFCNIYSKIYGVAFDKTETLRLFGSANLWNLYEKLSDHIVIEPLGKDDFIFSSREAAEAKIDNQKKIDQVERKTMQWDYPTLQECYRCIVEMLVSMYPETIPCSELGEYYKRFHRVQIDTEKHFLQKWEELVMNKEKLHVQNGRVGLSEKAKAEFSDQLNKKAVNYSVVDICPLFASDLGLYWQPVFCDDEDDDSSTQTSEYSFITSSTSAMDESASDSSRLDSNLKTVKNYQPNRSHLSPYPGDSLDSLHDHSSNTHCRPIETVKSIPGITQHLLIIQEKFQSKHSNAGDSIIYISAEIGLPPSKSLSDEPLILGNVPTRPINSSYQLRLFGEAQKLRHLFEE